ncbi:MAG TPA: OmpA family protein [Hyphomicrobiaceae bacterium]|nr:OmpA family protein [Hyphomicrobiaceae bacterium]
MTHETVDRLKHLLFEQESKDLSALGRRLDAVAARLEEVAQRASTDAHLRQAVARVLDKAIGDAEVDRHEELATSLAPVVVRTLRTELASPHTENQLVGVLYPRIGDMVRRFVSDAMRDLMDRINRSLESGLMNNGLVLRLRSLTTGRSMAELALADTQRLEVEEIYLIRRGSGELVHRWAGSSDAIAQGENRSTLVSGFLTALTAFAEEAFEADRASLRAVDLGEHRLYVRGSPTYLLALKCRGTAADQVEVLLDEELLKVLADQQEMEARQDGEAIPEEREQLLSGFAGRLVEKITVREAEIRRSRASRPLKLLLWLVGFPLAVFLGWQGWLSWQTDTLQKAADREIANVRELAGFPVTARVERGGGAVWIGGLAPDARTRELLIDRVAAALPSARVNATIGVLPTTDVGPEMRALALVRAVDRARRHLASAGAELDRVTALPISDSDRSALSSARQAIESATGNLETPRADQGNDQLLARLHASLRQLSERAAAIAALVTSGQPPVESQPTLPEGAIESAEQIVVLAERIAGFAGTLGTVRTATAERARAVALLDQKIAALTSRIEELRPRPPQPRQQLAEFIARNAIFFGNGTDYRDPASAASILDELANLAKAADVLVRVVGYTDDAGGAQRNAPLSQSRAEKVAEDLARRGVARNRLVSVGRATAIDLSPRAGATSNNRRVEFEIGFTGEEGGLQ